MHRTRNKRKQLFIALRFTAPFFLLYTVFTIWPVIQGVYVSLHKWTLMGKLKFVGLDNYLKFLGDKNFWGALQNTVVFVLITAPLLVITAMILALLANRPTRIKKGLRICYYLPSVLSVSVAAFIAKYMFAPYRGFINGFLHATGLLEINQELQWLQDGNLVWGTITSMTVWWTVGFSMILYLSAVQDTSPEGVKASAFVDAIKRQRRLSIDSPLLHATTVYL